MENCYELWLGSGCAPRTHTLCSTSSFMSWCRWYQAVVWRTAIQRDARCCFMLIAGSSRSLPVRSRRGMVDFVACTKRAVIANLLAYCPWGHTQFGRRKHIEILEKQSSLSIFCSDSSILDRRYRERKTRSKRNSVRVSLPLLSLSLSLPVSYVRKATTLVHHFSRVCQYARRSSVGIAIDCSRCSKINTRHVH